MVPVCRHSIPLSYIQCGVGFSCLLLNQVKPNHDMHDSRVLLYHIPEKKVFLTSDVRTISSGWLRYCIRRTPGNLSLESACLIIRHVLLLVVSEVQKVNAGYLSYIHSKRD